MLDKACDISATIVIISITTMLVVGIAVHIFTHDGEDEYERQVGLIKKCWASNQDDCHLLYKDIPYETNKDI